MLSEGENAEVLDIMQIRNSGVHAERIDNHIEGVTTMIVTTSDGSDMVVQPSVNRYPRRETSMLDPVIRSKISRDLFFTTNIKANGVARITIKRLPYLSLIWYGGILLLFGGLLDLLPEFSLDQSILMLRFPSGDSRNEN